MQKKHLLLGLILLVALTVMACSETPAPTAPASDDVTIDTPSEPVIQETREPTIPEVAKTTEPKEEKSDAASIFDHFFGSGSDEALVMIEDFRYQLFPGEIDEQGNQWGSMLYENNSEYPVRFFEIEYDAETEFPARFSSFNSVLPGETSPIISSDMSQGMTEKIARYIIMDGDTNYEITYDFETKKYKQIVDEYLDMDRVSPEDAPFLLDDFSIEYVTHPPDSLGIVYTDVTWKNGSDTTIDAIYLTMYSQERAMTYLYGGYEPVAAGEEGFLHSFGAEDLVPLDVQLVFTHEDTPYILQYDYKLDLYRLMVDYSQTNQ